MSAKSRACLQMESIYRFKDAKNTSNDQSLLHEVLYTIFAAVKAVQRRDLYEDLIAFDLTLKIEKEADIRAAEGDDDDVDEDDAENKFLSTKYLRRRHSYSLAEGKKLFFNQIISAVREVMLLN